MYGDGMELLAKINMKAGITPEEFIRYNNELPVEQLLTKWARIKNPASPDIKSAILALAAIGLYVDGITSLQGTRESIQTFLYTR